MPQAGLHSFSGKHISIKSIGAAGEGGETGGGQIDTLPSNLLRVNEKHKFAGLLRAYLKFYTILSERTSDKYACFFITKKLLSRCLPAILPLTSFESFVHLFWLYIDFFRKPVWCYPESWLNESCFDILLNIQNYDLAWKWVRSTSF